MRGEDHGKSSPTGSHMDLTQVGLRGVFEFHVRRLSESLLCPLLAPYFLSSCSSTYFVVHGGPLRSSQSDNQFNHDSLHSLVLLVLTLVDSVASLMVRVYMLYSVCPAVHAQRARKPIGPVSHALSSHDFMRA